MCPYVFERDKNLGVLIDGVTAGIMLILVIADVRLGGSDELFSILTMLSWSHSWR